MPVTNVKHLGNGLFERTGVSGTGLTEEQKDRIGRRVFDSSQTSLPTSLDGRLAATEQEITYARSTYASLGERLDAIGSGGGGLVVVGGSAVAELDETYIASEGQTVFTLQGKYTPGSGALNVFVNGILVRPGLDNDYVEASENQVTFNYGLTAGDVVTFKVMATSYSPVPTLYEKYIAAEGQTTFTLKGTYSPGYHSLMVFVNGLLNEPGEDYTEVDESTVQFLYPLPAGARVVFRVGGGVILKALKLVDAQKTASVDAGQMSIIEVELPSNAFLLKTLRVQADSSIRFDVEIYDKPSNGMLVYRNLDATELLYDIVDIPYVDAVGMNKLYLVIRNKSGSNAVFSIVVRGIEMLY